MQIINALDHQIQERFHFIGHLWIVIARTHAIQHTGDKMWIGKVAKNQSFTQQTQRNCPCLQSTSN